MNATVSLILNETMLWPKKKKLKNIKFKGIGKNSQKKFNKKLI